MLAPSARRWHGSILAQCFDAYDGIRVLKHEQQGDRSR